VIRERAANSLPQSSRRKAKPSHARVAKGTIVHADEAASRANRHERFAITRINHPEAYSRDGACADMAEEHVDLRRAAIAIQHIAGACLLRSPQGCARCDDNPGVGNRDQVNRIAA
jgi:hypothetical protein